MSGYYKQITPERKWFDLRLKELWQYRDLILLFTKRHFVLFYKQTILGPLWAIINPLLSSLLYMVVFGNIAKLSTDGTPQMVFYLSGTAVWSFFSTCVTTNADTFRSNANVFSKVYFPRMTVSVANVLSAFIRLGIQLTLVLALCVYYQLKGTLSPNWPELPLLIPLLAEIGLLGMGFGIIISSMTTKYRDLSILVTYGVGLWMYATPIVYPLATLGFDNLGLLIRLNPVTAPVEAFRRIVLGVGTVEFGWFVYSIVATVLVMLLGMLVFNRVERNFTDTI